MIRCGKLWHINGMFIQSQNISTKILLNCKKKKNNKSNFWAEESNIYNWSSCKVTVSNEANQQVPKNRFNKRQTYSLFWQNS